MPPGELLAAVLADPPRITSRRAKVASDRKKISAFPKAISPNCNTGKPSSCSAKNLAPPDATGKPRTAILALPSPPVDSLRTPGNIRKISAVLRGVATSISVGVKVLTETLDCITVCLRATAPVTTIRSKSRPAPAAGSA